jgi:hypothetical protein
LSIYFLLLLVFRSRLTQTIAGHEAVVVVMRMPRTTKQEGP